eukprot:s728_g42.t1
MTVTYKLLLTDSWYLLLASGIELLVACAFEIQAKAEEAKVQNALALAAHSDCAIAEANVENAVVPAANQPEEMQPASINALDFSMLSDEHYAISEKALDQARSSAPPGSNWVKTQAGEFEASHGSIIEPSASDDESDIEEEPILYPMEASEYEPMYTRCKELLDSVLRFVKGKRREKGHFHHPLVLLFEGAEVSEGAIRGAYLLARVQLRPFDTTGVKMEVASEVGLEEWVARMQSDANLPIAAPFSKIVIHMCTIPSLHVYMADYTGKAFGKLYLNKITSLAECLAAPAAQRLALEDEMREEEKELTKRLNMLKRTKDESKPSRQRKKTTAPRKQNRKGHPALEDESEEDPEEPGISGQETKQLEKAWQEAFQSEAVSSHKSASDASGSSSSPAAPPAERPQFNIPYCNDKGYCFVDVDGNGKPIHLGNLAFSGLHRNCAVLVGAKKLANDSEQRMLQWLHSGLAIKDKDNCAEHKKTSLDSTLSVDSHVQCSCLEGFAFVAVFARPCAVQLFGGLCLRCSVRKAMCSAAVWRALPSLQDTAAAGNTVVVPVVCSAAVWRALPSLQDTAAAGNTVVVPVVTFGIEFCNAMNFTERKLQ